MLFNSLEFFVFFITVLILYYSLPHRWQNRMLLAASYFFYGWWDWRFLSLIFISTCTDYFCGIKISEAETPGKKKTFLFASMVINLGILGFFKYWNFFIESFAMVLSQAGLNLNLPSLRIILPVGISFYTFQTMTYSVDIYRGEIKPTRDFLNYALFISFFPQLVAGPIERAKNLLSQIEMRRVYRQEQLVAGLHLIFWGLFKKVFVADNLGLIVDEVYSNPNGTAFQYVIGTWAFAFQIYGDFSGYTDVARGAAKCLGFEIMKNFRNPYFAVSPSDFWRRWHISLSTWLRDYLYIPMGGNRKGVRKTYRNLMATMLLGGLWHGAAWNFVIWGGYHGLLLSVHRWFQGKRGRRGSSNRPKSSLTLYLLKAFLMFQMTCLGWIFFRAGTFTKIRDIIMTLFTGPYTIRDEASLFGRLIFYISIPLGVMVFRIFQEIRPGWFDGGLRLNRLDFAHQSFYFKSILYGALTYLLCLYGASAKSFIYFQF
jgi:D-alanyl-lipoteichoic acid acyltransferase DltB (MBOAT superfamily)